MAVCYGAESTPFELIKQGTPVELGRRAKQY